MCDPQNKPWYINVALIIIMDIFVLGWIPRLFIERIPKADYFIEKIIIQCGVEEQTTK